MCSRSFSIFRGWLANVPSITFPYLLTHDALDRFVSKPFIEVWGQPEGLVLLTYLLFLEQLLVLLSEEFRFVGTSSRQGGFVFYFCLELALFLLFKYFLCLFFQKLLDTGGLLYAMLSIFFLKLEFLLPFFEVELLFFPDRLKAA